MILKILSDGKMRSTNEVVKEVEEIGGSITNWHMIYRILAELHNDGKIEKLQAKIGFFWRKKS